MIAQILENLPSAEYHALERFSASGIKKLLVSAQDFYVSSWMNPNRVEIESDAFNLGTAYHARILEGKQFFQKAYAVKPDCDRRTKEGKAIYAAWQEQYPDADPIEQHVMDQINAAAERIESKTCIFKEGKPEVTVLWDDEETGVPMKARFDYLKYGEVLDLKTFSNSSGHDPLKLIASHIGKYKYNVQFEVYREAHKITLGTHPEIIAVFQQTGQANNCIVKPFPADLLMASQGRDLMRKGINKFRDMFEKFGTEPWYDDFGNNPLKDEDFPLYMLEE